MSKLVTPYLCDSGGAEPPCAPADADTEAVPPAPASARVERTDSAAQAVPAAAPYAAVSAAGLPSAPPRWPLPTLGAAAVLGMLYYGQNFLAPLIVAAFIALFLSPVVRRLKKYGLPESVGAGVVVMVVVALIWLLANAIKEPATQLLESWPHAKAVLAAKLAEFNRYLKFDDGVQPFAWQPPGEETADSFDLIGGMPRVIQYVLGSLSSVASSSFVIVLGSYAFLASGDGFLRKLVATLPTLSDKKRLVEIVSYLKRDLGRYWWTTGWINAALGGLACVAFLFVGLPSALLWGVMVALLNFIPIVGPLVCTLALGFAGMLAFDEWNKILSVPLIYLVLHTLESQFITPHILGHRLRLNPTVVVLSILFWSSLWGILGTFIAVPFLICLKIVCGHVGALHPISDFLE